MMDLGRFAHLLDAYGAAPHRWPEAERPAALALLRQDRRAERLLNEAGDLDDQLAGYTLPPPSPTLTASILAGIPRRPVRRVRLWWAALGAAGIALGGAAAGGAASAALLPALSQPADLHEDLTAFGGAPAEEQG